MLEGEVYEEQASDGQLLAVLKAGVERSDWAGRNSVLEEFYSRYAPKLATTWLRRTGNPELVQEIVQETFLRATTKLYTLPETHSVLIWLRTTARNFYLDRMRHSKLEHDHMAQQGAPQSPPRRPQSGFEDAVLLAADRGKVRGIIERYLRTLNPQDREILLLRTRGLRMPQICERLKISERECRRSYARVVSLMERMRELGLSSHLSEVLGQGPWEGDKNARKPS